MSYVYLYKQVYLVECETFFIIALTNPVYNRDSNLNSDLSDEKN